MNTNKVLDLIPQRPSTDVAKDAAQKAANSVHYESKITFDLYIDGNIVTNFSKLKKGSYLFVTLKYGDEFCWLVDFQKALLNSMLVIKPLVSQKDGAQYTYHYVCKKTVDKLNKKFNFDINKSYAYYSKTFLLSEMQFFNQKYRSEQNLSTNNGFLVLAKDLTN